ncbi:MAG: hypothetical protein E7620_06270 [Ruminococcaceae bacterium]|nr:hypothetical protein [Oscillospiraceae bacterium]
MRKRMERRVSLAILLGILLSLACLFPTAAESETPVVSHGLLVLSARTNVAVNGMVGNDVPLTKEVFQRGMNLSSVRYITLKTLPSIAEGELLMGSTKVVAGQTLSGESLGNLIFRPEAQSGVRSEFQFTINESATPVLCAIYLLEEPNYTPTVSMASGLSLKVRTYKEMAAYGTLSAYDPDGDSLIFEIVSYPKNGSLEITDTAKGSYVYRPNAGYVGGDSFTYVARDAYGNYSASATVSLTVNYAGTSISYADMETSKSYNAALTVTEKGIMSGTQVGNEYYFYPDQEVSRVEFLVMAMNSAGIREVPDCVATPFADDADIPDAMKGYVAAALSLGIVQGSENEKGELCFDPQGKITRAHAAVMLDALLDPKEGPALSVFQDHSSIPVWAADAIYTLSAAGILTSGDGYFAPEAPVTRAAAAELFTAVMAYIEG